MGTRSLVATLSLLVCVAFAWWFVRADPPGAAATVGPAEETAPPTVPAADEPLLLAKHVEEEADRALVEMADPTPVPALESERAGAPLLVVFGFVTNPGGQPIEEKGWLVFVDASGRRVTAGLESGRYETSSLAPGVWNAKCSVNGYEPEERTVTIAAAEERRREDFAPARAWTIDVCLAGPFGNAFQEQVEERGGWHGVYPSAIATREAPGVRVEPTMLRHHMDYDVGRYRGRLNGLGLIDVLPIECIGRLTVGVDPPVHVSLVVRDHVVTTQLVASRIDRVVFELAAEDVLGMAAGFRLRVVDRDTGGSVATGSATVGHRQALRFVQLDEQGVLIVEELTPGLVEIVVRVPGYAQGTLEADLEPGRVTDLGVLELERPASIAGCVLDPSGEPLATRIRVFEYLPEDLTEMLKSSRNIAYPSGEDGRFDIRSLTPGRYVLLAGVHAGSRDDAPWAAPPKLVDLRSGPALGIELRAVATARLTLTPLGSDIVRLKYRVVTLDGLPVKYGAFVDQATVGYDLAPGAYRFILLRDGTTIRTMDFTLAPTGTALEVTP